MKPDLDYSEYLAANVLNDQLHVSYRNLSRALKVHSNLAKQMLYEFHRKQNSKKPGSVHATYLLTGTKRPAQSNGTRDQQDGEDSIMQSSPPFPSSSVPQPDAEEKEITPVKSIMLVKEENLDQARALFDTITGIHVYSLQANGLGDLQVLTECNRRVTAEYASEDPLEAWKQYGTIQNPGVRRRAVKRPPPSAPAAAKAEPVEAETKTKTAPKDLPAEQSKNVVSKPAGSKRQESSIFKSFAKGAAKPIKSETQPNSAAVPPPPAAEPEDAPMTGFSSDDDNMDGDDGLSDGDEKSKAPTGKTRQDRQAELEAMMEQEDEKQGEGKQDDSSDEPMEDASQHDAGAIDQPASQEPASTQENVTVENGRRRGRRRVMKKKTTKDEDGFLVTREEAAWESFSEEEPAPKKAKIQAGPPAAAAQNPSAAAGGGKKAGKAGQGNIMSFFAKK